MVRHRFSRRRLGKEKDAGKPDEKAKTDQVADSKTETKADTKADTKTDGAADSKGAAKTEAKTESKSEPASKPPPAPTPPKTGSSGNELGPRRMFKRYLIAGLLVWIPLAITFWLLELIVSTMDQTLLLLPPSGGRTRY